LLAAALAWVDENRVDVRALAELLADADTTAVDQALAVLVPPADAKFMRNLKIRVRCACVFCNRASAAICHSISMCSLVTPSSLHILCIHLHST
jgi:nitrate reductase beta subunit